jgi:valyl-tRNA synthetase
VRDLPPGTLTLADRWILSRLQATVREATSDLEQFRLDDAARTCFDFAWGHLADWYVEAVKLRLQAGDADAATAQSVLAECFDTVLRLLHPVVPFITEELWQKLPGRVPDDLLALAAWPIPDGRWDDASADAQFADVQGAVVAVRNIRAEYRVPPRSKLGVTLVPRSDAARQAFDAERDTIARLALASDVTVGDRARDGGASTVLADGSEVYVALAGAVDTRQECRRLTSELERLDQQLAGLAAKLANAQFTARAPADVVAREREKESAWRDQRAILAGKLRALGCG